MEKPYICNLKSNIKSWNDAAVRAAMILEAMKNN